MAGEDGKAICRLRDSLAVLKTVVHPSPPNAMLEGNNIEAPSCTTLNVDMESLLGLSCFPFDNQMESTSRRIRLETTMNESPCSSHLPLSVGLPGLQHDSQAFIYSRPFTFKNILSSRDLDIFLHVHSAVVIFNMALAHHRIGKSTGKRVFLEKAVLFYDMCIELLENCDEQTGSARLIELASLNNASLIRIEFGDHSVARRGLDLLSVLLVRADSEILASLNEEDVRGFLLNVMLLRHALAAAAA